MLFALVALDRPNAVEDRLRVRPDHLKFLDSLGDSLLLAGPFLNDKGESVGSIVIIESESLDTARAAFTLPVRLVSIWRLKASAGSTSKRPDCTMPAEVTRISQAPASASHRPIASMTAASSATSTLSVRTVASGWLSSKASRADCSMAGVRASNDTLSPRLATLQVGQTLQLLLNLPDTLRGQVLWRSLEPRIAIVNQDGFVTAVAPGQATILARMTFDTNVVAPATIVVPGVINLPGVVVTP